MHDLIYFMVYYEIMLWIFIQLNQEALINERILSYDLKLIKYLRKYKQYIFEHASTLF